jgi:hypothetical protein
MRVSFDLRKTNYLRMKAAKMKLFFCYYSLRVSIKFFIVYSDSA